MYHSLFIHSLSEKHLGWFQVLGIMNKGSVSIYVLVFEVFDYVWISGNVIAVSYVNSMFSFERNR